jgi:hypothetical protein
MAKNLRQQQVATRVAAVGVAARREHCDPPHPALLSNSIREKFNPARLIPVPSYALLSFPPQSCPRESESACVPKRDSLFPPSLPPLPPAPLSPSE